MQHITPAALLSAMTLAFPCLAEDESDAAFRSRLLANTAAYDSFDIAGENGASLSIGGYIMARYIVGYSEGFEDKDVAIGFDMPRVRLGASGQIDETFGYVFQADFSDPTPELTDGYITAKLSSQSKLQLGQFYLPFTREQDVSSTRQVAAERSIANSFFTVDRSQGVMLVWTGEELRWRNAISDGAKAVNTEYLDEAEADFAYTTRLEYLAAGKWGQFKDFQGWRGGEFGLMLGGAAHYQTAGDTGAYAGDPPVYTSTAENDILAFTLDASAEFNGASAMAAFYYRDRETGSGDFTDLGFIVQGSVMASDQTELFVRWDSVLADSDRAANDDVHTLTAGATYFFVPESHALKFTFDVQHVLSDLNDTPVGSNGKRTIHASDDPQTALRAQFVLRF